MDFSRGPPELSGLDKTQKIELMRQYRLWKERPHQFDFSRGAPDVSHLEGSERLKVLRAYRQWQQEQGLLPNSPDSHIVARPPAFAPPTSPEIETITLPDESAAGMASGIIPSKYSYFERPLSERSQQRATPSARTAAWVMDHSNPPSPQRAPPLTVPSPRCHEGAAGLSSSARQQEYSWLETEEPRRHRALFPKTRELGESERRVFAPDLLRPDGLAEETQRKVGVCYFPVV